MNGCEYNYIWRTGDWRFELAAETEPMPPRLPTGHSGLSKKRSMDVTEWLVWFLQTLQRSLDHAAEGAVTKTEAWGEGQFIVPRMLPKF